MRDTYKYYFKVGNKIVHGGITKNLPRREGEHRRSGKITRTDGKTYKWSDGHIYQFGLPVTWESALKWERTNGFGANQ